MHNDAKLQTRKLSVWKIAMYFYWNVQWLEELHCWVEWSLGLFFLSIILLWSYHSHHTQSSIIWPPVIKVDETVFFFFSSSFFSAGLMDLVPLGSSANERLTDSQHTWPASMQAHDFDLYWRLLFFYLFISLLSTLDLWDVLNGIEKTKAVWLDGKEVKFNYK